MNLKNEVSQVKNNLLAKIWKNEIVDGALRTIEKSLQRFVNKGKKNKEEKAAVLGRITKSIDLNNAANA